MGFRLGRRIVKIWKRMTRSRKARSYARLRHEDPRKPLRLRLGRKLWRRSGKCSNFNDSREQSAVSLLHSEDHPQGFQFHLPRLELDSLNFLHWHFPAHFHLPHISHGYKKGLGLYDGTSSKHVPKGFLAVYVGQGEEHERYVIPVMYFNHPLFGELLREAEKVYGFDQKGTITIPCELADFEKVQRRIDAERSYRHKL